MSRAGVLATVVLAGCGAQPDPVCPEPLVPAYVSADEFLRIAERAPLPRLLVVNPASGPGTEAEPAFRRAIATAQANGARVLGYVATRWGARPRAEVARDVRRYRAWYGIDGIFLDEAGDDEPRIDQYRALAADARAAGADFLVLNPGVVPARAYFELADVVVTFEGSYADYRRWHPPAWLDSERTAHLVYAAPQAADVPPNAYLTTGTLPHPWGTVTRPRACP
ncbi:spherulation-specific family 4 protein [Solirubrobacter sp. CPCC 204708]|uniref:Spherulation-specific family 4 protein n=1 Tax=Solirubrobacter deserti TaxID=2282478 RepID=A0ABT4RF71_9ACTN|nr:spherulation-specific family 4 protein [Solirubrobacter deserti]MBE2319512.1 spherulation-specific family 4 protein [Solirubrobacter deserti]MDA0137201.1 spherulation-specific family 4 protein [Solirubrobacter deserti]